MSQAIRPIHALFPGTFDPVTHGHLDVVRRAAALFERLTVAVAHHPLKKELLPVGERLALLREVTADMRGVDVVQIEGLVVHGCAQVGASVIVRGVRSASDLDYELQMARTNRALAPQIETVLIASSPEHAHISSTLVRQVAEMGGELSAFVPPQIAKRLRARPTPQTSPRPA
ncbi:MAG TPA: pantetheine-phosphate adenylyltransferase [Planctomycetota bacterium]|nr:pantetheine-phosphate adenylyltransferase [Planctomycetota bacterium]